MSHTETSRMKGLLRSPALMDYTLEPNLTVTSDYYYPDTFSSPCDGELIQRDSKLLLAIIYCFLFVFGLLGNSLVILVLVVCKKLRSITDIYLLNLALSDLLFVFSFPFQTHYQLDQWVFGTVLCKVFSGFYYIGFFSSMFFITLMSMDRYLAVVHAVYAIKVRTVRTGTVLSLAVWLITMIATGPLLVFYQVASEDGVLQCYSFYNQQTLKWKIFIHFEINILGLLIPFAILLFCYARILHQLKTCQNHNKTKAIKLVLIVVVASLLFWVPFNVVLFLTSLHDMHVLDGCILNQQLIYATHVTETISFTHCCVNPVIYAFMGEKFKKCLSEIFQKIFSYIFPSMGRQMPREGWERRSSSHPMASRSSSIDYIL
ncbi:C-C chemokine receptor type 8 [Urocitellus parryii]